MSLVPDLNPAFDMLPEKLVQQCIHSLCDPLLVDREVSYDGYYCDFRTPKYLIEVKRASSNGPPNSVARPHSPLGQILYYQVAHSLEFGAELTPVILIYGSKIDKYLTKTFTAARHKFGVRLWVLTSLRNGTMIDLDTHQTNHLAGEMNETHN